MIRELQGHTALQGRHRRRVERLPLAAAQPPHHHRRLRAGAQPHRRSSAPTSTPAWASSASRVTPYYASLMDPDDPDCPVRMQGVPTPAELVIHHEDIKDAVSRGLRLADAAHHAPLPRPRALRGHRDVQHVLPPLHAAAPRRRHRGHRRADRDRQRHQVHRARPRGPRRAHQRRRPAGAQPTSSSRASSSACAPSPTWRSSASARACRWSARSASPPSW